MKVQKIKRLLKHLIKKSQSHDRRRQKLEWREDDPRENVEVDLTDEQFLMLAQEAHRQDITFNQLVENIIRKRMEEEESKTSEQGTGGQSGQ